MTFGLIYGLYSRAASNQERPMMAGVRYISLKVVTLYYQQKFPGNEFLYVGKQRGFFRTQSFSTAKTSDLLTKGCDILLIVYPKDVRIKAE